MITRDNSGETYRGSWSLIALNIKCTGRLFFDDQNRILLEVDIEDADLTTPLEDYECPVIYGDLAFRDRYTLINCAYTRYYSNGNIASITYVPEYVLSGGVHVKPKTKFSLAAFHYSGLDEWVNKSGFSVKDRSTSKKIDVSIGYKQPDKIKLLEVENITGNLFFSAKVQMFRVDTKERKLNQKVFINLHYNKEITLEQVESDILILRDYFSFATGKAVAITEIEVRSGESKFMLKLNYISQANIKPLSMNHKTLFSYKDISSNAVEITSKWFEIVNKTRDVFSLYFDCIYHTKLLESTYFLNLTFALESYHRKNHNKPKVDPEEWKKIRQTIKSTLEDNPHSETVLDKLNWNEPTLKDRLEDIISWDRVLIQSFISDTDGLIITVRDTRNYLVHLSKKANSSIVKKGDYYIYNTALRLLLELIIMRELGMTTSLIREGLNRVIHYQDLKRREKF